MGGWAAAATLSRLDFCDRKLEEVQTWHTCSYHGLVVQRHGQTLGSTFDLDPVALNIKILLKMDTELCPGQISVAVNWKKFKLGTDIPTMV